MMQDSADLSNMRDLAVPPDVSWWPPAIGWWLLFTVVLVMCALSFALVLRKWKMNAYRRQAIRDLQKADSPAVIADLLKRTALVAWPRLDVAGLTGSAWCKWLGASAKLVVPESVCQSLTTTLYREDSRDIPPELRQFARQWISQHEPDAQDELAPHPDAQQEML